MLKLLGGEIEAESQLGAGTKVTFCVPLRISDKSVTGVGRQQVRDDESTVEQMSSQDEEPDDREALPKVLIAEDDEFGRATAAMMLEHKYQLTFAENGQEVVEKYFAVSPDLVLMDIMMPVMDGYKAFAEIKRRCEGQTVPIIALTAKAMKEDRQQLLEHGFADYVSKPIESGALMKTIDKHLAAGVTASPEDRSYQ
jgi:CheY-like chemotaxis protein